MEETVRVLGKGSYGVVSLVRRTHSAFYHYYLAKKSSPFSRVDNLEKELRILSRFRGCPGIVRCFSSCLETDILADTGLVCNLYLEYAAGGTLSDLIRKNGGRLSEREVSRYTRMILQGLKTLHSMSYVHCDLKPDNILVFPSIMVPNGWDLKLSDFGLAKEPRDDDVMIKPGYRGTPKYMPPESIGPGGLIGPWIDIWSLGCVVVKMLGGYSTVKKADGSWAWSVPSGLSREAEDFLKRCMDEKPLRWRAYELLEHPFILQSRGPIVPVPMPVCLPGNNNGVPAYGCNWYLIGEPPTQQQTYGPASRFVSFI